MTTLGTRMARSIATAACLLTAVTASAQTLLVEKKGFTLPSYTTVAGAVIQNVRVGYETYGKLNERGDNAVFVSHFYSGSSHAAGKYKESDVTPGYWDALIGKGKAIDTDRWFVVAADALCNLNVKDPNVVTTGPASQDPATGKPYAMSFPVVSLRDTVRVHRALLDALGVKKLAAATGASAGSMQAMEWAALYPDFVERVVHVIGPGFDIHPFVVALLDVWTLPVRVDARWNGGDYYGREEPVDGVARALQTVTLTTRSFAWAEKTFGYKWADAAKDPARSPRNSFAIDATLASAGAARARTTDANSMLCMSRANQLYRLSDAEVKGIRAKILFVPASSDMVFPPELSRRAMERFRAQGGRAEIFVLEGDGGHLDGLLAAAKATEPIRKFLETR